MSRLTETDSQGNWALSGVAWKSLYAGQIITDGMWEKLYGALWKLMEYENTGFSPDQIPDVEDLHDISINYCTGYLVQTKKRWYDDRSLHQGVWRCIF